MKVPHARGPRSAAILNVLTTTDAADAPTALLDQVVQAGPVTDPLVDEDLQLSLLVLYELHYRGIDGVNDRWEWHPDLLQVRAVLEGGFERALRQAAGAYPALDKRKWEVSSSVSGQGWQRGGIAGRDCPDDELVMRTLLEMTAPTGKPGLSSYLARYGSAAQYEELLIHRSIYHLKEADPHTWGIPRLSGSVKAALVEIQADEYGGGRPEWVHAQMFADAMVAFGLDTRYGYYLDEVPGVTLAVLNAMSLFGLHRRLRGALVGHLAAFEMTSTMPNRMYAQGLRRLGYPDAVGAYFQEHVEADAVHEQIALRDLARGLVNQEPDLADDVIFGAAAALVLDEAAAGHLLGAWRANRSSLRDLADTLSAS